MNVNDEEKSDLIQTARIIPKASYFYMALLGRLFHQFCTNLAILTQITKSKIDFYDTNRLKSTKTSKNAHFFQLFVC